MNYFVWQANPSGGYCTLEYLKNVDEPHEIKRGFSRAADFSEEACFHMDASHPKEVKLADNIFNLDRMLVVSKSLKEIVESESPPFTEFLPVSIYNHKGRVASTEYFIINPFDLQDCIDQNQSKLKWNKIDPELISGCYNLVISPEKIEENRLLFRPKYLPTIVLVREDLVDMIKAKGFTGIRFKELDEFQI